jgi:hypothetical protein
MADSVKKTIVVSGDLIWDYNLAQHPIALNYHSDPLQHTVLHYCAGGAWYLRELVGLACSDLDVTVLGPPQSERPQIEEKLRVSQAYNIWSQYERCAGGSNKQERVWRISQFLGCQRQSDEAQPAEIRDDKAEPNILALDDLGLGFRDHKRLWPAALQEGEVPEAVVCKTALPLEGPLWKRLLTDEYAQRLTVVLSVAALRARRAVISRAFSWDQTIEEIQREFMVGQSAQDLGRCQRVIVHFGVAGAACFKAGQFERFLYHPDEIEGSWLAQRPGKTFGFTSLLTAALVRHELQKEEFPLYLALCRGLGAMRVNHDLGRGTKDYTPVTTNEAIRQMLRPPQEPNVEKTDEKKEQQSVAVFKLVGRPEEIYCTAYPHYLLVSLEPVKQSPQEIKSDLLQDLTGSGLEYVAAKAMDVVLRGPNEALREAPKARYGDYLTVDREEIERINEIRSLIVAYRENLKDKRPLSLAVFGPPGSGKSFAIKQLAKELFGAKQATLEFNLSQFTSVHDLHTAFQQVRDASVQGQLPLVFWDEFDTAVGENRLGWLKEFLAPMQDAKFQAGSLVHSFGKAIFVFAGGTCRNFQSFDQSRVEDEEGKKLKKKTAFEQVKGPDFVSRLRGFINIKGPNKDTTQQTASNSQRAKKEDKAYLIRRAILLRSVIERSYPHLIDPQTKMAAISASVIRGFLRVKEYLHGARSLEAVVNMSSLNHARHFSIAELPSKHLLRLHVTDDFLELVAKGQIEAEIVEAIAKDCHERWRQEKKRQGYRWGEVRDETKHPLLRPYDESSELALKEDGTPLPPLTEPEKEKNRLPARLTQAKLKEVGIRIERESQAKTTSLMSEQFAEVRTQLMKIEHDIWLRDHLLNGYDRSSANKDHLRLHRDIAPFEEVKEEDKQLVVHHYEVDG